MGFGIRDGLSSIQDTGFGIWDSRYCLFIFLFRTQDSGFEIVFSYVSSGDRIWDSGFEKLAFQASLQDAGFGIRDLR